jgi:hypothetical protein
MKPDSICEECGNLWLRAAGEALWGARWQAPMARAIGRSRNHVIRCAAGSRPLPDDDVEKIMDLLDQRHEELRRIVQGNAP